MGLYDDYYGRNNVLHGGNPVNSANLANHTYSERRLRAMTKKGLMPTPILCVWYFTEETVSWITPNCSGTNNLKLFLAKYTPWNFSHPSCVTINESLAERTRVALNY